MITIPESVAFYWADPTNRAAVNVLAERNEVPPDLTLDEAEQFELACLSARRVRVDLWRLLRFIWSATWEGAVYSEFPAARLLTYGGHAEFEGGDYFPSVDRAWEGRTFCGTFDLPSRGKLVTMVSLKGNDQDVEVGFAYQDHEGDWTVGDKVELGPEWTTDEGWRVAGPGHIRMAGGAPEIDPASLAALCRSALAALKAALA